NKELVAKHGVELLEIALKNNINYLFEASVGGGIPILRPIQQCLSANCITEVYGILNGTTNYILTEMSQKGATFEDALAQAQKNGYAEANPSADVDGIDACRKICILSDLCFGKNFSPDWVKTVGIRAVSEHDTKYANQGGYTIKLLGRAVTDKSTDKVAVYVAPHLISSNNLLASVTGVMNGIVVRGNALGDVMFYGAGAGKMPTASAVVADIIDCCRHTKNRKRIMWARGAVEDTFPSADISSRWYARVASPEGTVKKHIPDAEILGGDVSQTGFIAGEKTKHQIHEQLSPFEVLSLFRVI
ncbi:MAG: homoserine dehydrogenase, partial [Oscillospiraceae bacterium]|nr:homoserine dehydrogenase [Oscillospiraceae bacterium]